MPDVKPFRTRKKKLGSYPSISVIFSITLALFVMGVFGTLIIYSGELERAIRENVKIQVYLNNGLTSQQRVQIEKSLTTRDYIRKDADSVILFVSKDEAADSFIAETGEDFEAFLGSNPLRDYYHVSIDPAFQDSSSMAEIKADVESMPGVFQVYYVENLIDSINQNVVKISLILLGISVLLLIIVILLINNTLRLALFSQRFLIRSMQLVGATRWFIQRPFMMRALFHGFASGILAASMLLGAILLAHRRIEELALIQNTDRITILAACLIVLGMMVATLSTYSAVRKYLQLSLDELY